MAREVILFIAASIDGFIADKAGGVAWLEENIRGDEEDRSYDEMYEKIDTVVMGRTTYDQVTQELPPDVYFYEDKHSYIITSHPEPSTASKNFYKGRSRHINSSYQRRRRRGNLDCWRPESGSTAFGS